MTARATVWPATADELLARVRPALERSRTLGEAAAVLGVTEAALQGALRHKRVQYVPYLKGTKAAPAHVPPPPPEPPPPEPPPPPPEAEPGVVYAPPPPPVVPVGKDITASLVGDVHAPEEDRLAWSACMRWHAEIQPDLVVLNEICEWLSMTKHGGNWGAMFDQDVRAARRKLVQVRSVCPNSRIVLLETNHDTRLSRRVREMMPQLVGRLIIPQELHLDDLGIEWVPETIPFRIGRLKVIHGHQLSSNPKGMVPENACKRAVQRFGEPGWTVVFFHTHRKGYWMERHDTGVLEAVNLPCLRTLAPDWTQPAPTGWSHGFGVAHIGPAGQTNLYPVDIEHGAFVYGGKRFTA